VRFAAHLRGDARRHVRTACTAGAEKSHTPRRRRAPLNVRTSPPLPINPPRLRRIRLCFRRTSARLRRSSGRLCAAVPGRAGGRVPGGCPRSVGAWLWWMGCASAPRAARPVPAAVRHHVHMMSASRQCMLRRRRGRVWGRCGGASVQNHRVGCLNRVRRWDASPHWRPHARTGAHRARGCLRWRRGESAHQGGCGGAR
jgi:hypothetical protein